MKKNKGFTLVELLVAMAILILLIVILIGIINPIALVGKANDSKRKKDLDQIKKSFEEYYNDNGHYPKDVEDWNTDSNCGSNTIAFSQYLNPWPCDPNDKHYYIFVDNDGKSFKIMTNLENKNDKAIPLDWYSYNEVYQVDGYTIDEVNYGVSSPNISWYKTTITDNCTLECYQLSVAGKCNSALAGCSEATGNVGCYHDSSCNSSCRVKCCGAGCN